MLDEKRVKVILSDPVSFIYLPFSQNNDKDFPREFLSSSVASAKKLQSLNIIPFIIFTGKENIYMFVEKRPCNKFSTAADFIKIK